MANPRTAEEVLACAKEAITIGRFLPSVHFRDRMDERNVDMTDIHTAIDRSHHAEPYPEGKVKHGGSSWRILGPNCDGNETIAVGVEVWREPNGMCWICLCTVM